MNDRPAFFDPEPPAGALRQTVERLRLVLEGGGIGSFDWDLATNRIHRSPEYLALHGLPVDSPLDGFYSDAWKDRLHPEDRTAVLGWFEHDLANPGPFAREYRIRRADTGETRWISNRGVVTAGPDGRPARLLSAQIDVTQRRRAEERYHSLVNSIDAGFCIIEVEFDGDGRAADYRFLEVNPAFERQTGLGDAAGKSMRSLAPAHEQHWFDLYGQVALTGEPASFEHQAEALGRWFDVFAFRVAEPELRRVAVLFNDITERKRSELRLRESEERFRLIADSAPVPMWVTRLDRKRSFVNLAYAAFLGVSYEDALDYDWRLAIHPDDVERLTAESMAGEAALQPFTLEARYRRADGEWRWLRSVSQPRWGPDGEHEGFIGVAHDVTEPKAHQARLEEEHRTLETLNRTGAALVGELDLERIVQMVTDAGVELTGAQFGAFFYNVEDEAGESYMLYTLSGVDRSAFERFPMPRNTAVFGPTFRGEGVVRSDDITADPRYGRNAPYHGVPEGHPPVRSYLAVPVNSRSGAVIGGLFFGHADPERFVERHEQLMVGLAAQAAIGIENARLYQAADRELEERRRAEERLRELNETLESRVAEEIGERLKAEETLRQSQKMEAIGQLTGGIAHDFNNLLTVIMSSVDLLRRPGVDEEKRARYVDAIGETAARAAALTGQLLAFARRQPLSAQAFDLCARIKGLEPMLRTVLGTRIALSVTPAAAPCLVEADPNQLDSAVLNMAVNARDAMPDGGALSISVADGPDWIELAVADSGTGIAPDALALIFEPFYTTKGVGKGTGLGLSQVYGFARQSGGEVAVASELGQGSTFTLRLPRSDRRPAEGGESGGRPEPIAARPGRILVVEDNREVGESAVRLLEDMGHRVDFAADAAEALDRILRRGEAYDLVFTDVIMPGALDGLGLARMLREQRADLPVVLTTGYSHSLAEDATHGFELLRKPYRADALARLLARVMRVGDG